MLWAPPSKYTSQSVRSACGRDAEHQELRRKASETNLATSNSVRQLQSVLSTSRSARRLGNGEGLLSQRFSSCAHISPILKSEGSRTSLKSEGSRTTAPDPKEATASAPRALSSRAHISPVLNSEGLRTSGGDPKGQMASGPRLPKPANQQSMRRLPISALQADYDPPPYSGERSPSHGATSSRSRLTRQDRPRSPSIASAVSSAAPTAREGATPRIQIRSRCPTLENLIEPKDIAVMTQWYSDFERPLSSAFPDSRCPYAWLDPVAQGPDLQALDSFEEPWKFTDFQQEWDYPDLLQFSAWFKDRGRRKKEKVCSPEETRAERDRLSREVQDLECEVDDSLSILQGQGSLSDIGSPNGSLGSATISGSPRPEAAYDLAPRQPPLGSLPTPARAVPVYWSGDQACTSPRGKGSFAAHQSIKVAPCSAAVLAEMKMRMSVRPTLGTNTWSGIK